MDERRTTPLCLYLPGCTVALTATDVHALIDGIDALVLSHITAPLHERLEQARTLLLTPQQLSDPPLRVDEDTARLLLQVVVDMAGYQRKTLSPGLAELRGAL